MENDLRGNENWFESAGVRVIEGSTYQWMSYQWMYDGNQCKGKSILVRVSARFELARVRVIGSRLYLFHFSTSTFLPSTTWVRTCLLLRRFVFRSHRGEPETRLTGEEAPKFSSRFSSRDVFVRGSVRTARTGLGRRHRFGRRPKPRKRNLLA